MSEEDQDAFLAEWVLDSYENGESKNVCSWTLSAVQKIFPRLRLKTCWKVLDVWNSLMPVKQAPAAPPELIQAMVIMAVVLSRPHLGMLILLCFVGLLRVREALSLRPQDLIVHKHCVILCLGVTKRGMEQKVVLSNFTVVQFVSCFLQRFPPLTYQTYLLNISYSSALRWIRKLAEMLGAGDLGLTTHSFRRSGASELARQGVSLPDILLYGRRLSEKSAREYIRRGEVAIYRARNALHVSSSRRIELWSRVGLQCWHWFDVFYKHGELKIDVRKLSMDKLSSVERVLFGGT
jgi:integrase